MENKIRNLIKEAIGKLLNETIVTIQEPKNYKLFKISPEEFQYGFRTTNDNVYYLSLKETEIKTNDENVLKLYISDENNAPLKFKAINFFTEENNPNDAESFTKITGKYEHYLILGNICWLIDNFCQTYSEEKYFLFSAEPKRMKLYSNIFENLKDKFNIFPPKMYDNSYQYNQVIMIKK